MIRCITIGTTTVQGTLVRELPDGRAQVRVGEMVYTGQLIDQYQKFAATASSCNQQQKRSPSNSTSQTQLGVHSGPLFL
jgi:hypothetical protein